MLLSVATFKTEQTETSERKNPIMMIDGVTYRLNKDGSITNDDVCRLLGLENED